MGSADSTFVTAAWPGSPSPASRTDCAPTELLETLLGQLAALEREQSASVAILELVTKVVGADDAAAACRIIASELEQHLGCEQIAVGLCSRSRGVSRVIALSGTAELDPHSELASSIEAAMNEAAARGATLCSLSPDDTPLAQRSLSRLLGGACVLSVPLTAGAENHRPEPQGVDPAGDKTTRGVIVAIGPAAATAEVRHMLEAASQPLAVALTAPAKGRAMAILSRVAKLSATVGRKRARIIAAAAAATLMLLLVPLPYKVRCECELQPISRRFVAAPYDGIFETSLVKPGSVVRRGEVLARMDGRELRMELAGAEADHQRAQKSSDVNLATDKVAAAQMDRLEVQRLQLKQRLLRSRAKNLEIKSPLAGIVISGDLERSQGAPVKMGQTLYEVAPLERMVAELAIPDAEIARVAAGARVRIKLDAFAGQTWEAKLARLHPRSEIREHDNVFLGEVVLDNADRSLLPGMQGRATIYGPRQSLASLIFSKAWYKLVGWFGW